MDWKKVGWGLLIFDLIVVNLGVGVVLYELINKKDVSDVNADQVNTKTEYVDRCGSDCLAAIENRVSQLGKVSMTITPSVTPRPTVVTAKKTITTKTRREEILTIPGSGSTGNNAWESLSGTQFYFDTRDYPGIKEVYFEANMYLANGNGKAYVRLFDVTHGIGVVGSDNDTELQTAVWAKSQKVSFWAGRNLIQVQAKSLTADTSVYNQGRLIIVTEN